jgi:4-hydroxy-2-oxoheptanedioate aldolase
MTAGSLAQRLSSDDRLVGVILKMSSPVSVELAGHLGFDLVVIDTEHGLTGGAELDNHRRAADAAAVPAVVRIGSLDRAEIARALDAGAAGVVIPQVESAAAARAAVRLAHYPPTGARGLATSTRAGRQGTVPTAEHLAAAAADTVVIVQIESAAGVAAAADIVAVEGVSGVWIGLSDLSLDLGHVGEYDHPVVADAIQRVLDATREAGLPLLVIADTDAEGAAWSARGARVLLINLLTVLARGLSSLQSAHRGARSERIPT